MNRHLEKLIGILLTTLVGLLGKLSWGTSQQLGRALGNLLYTCNPHHRRIALDNLARALPELTLRRRQEIARGVFHNLGIMFFDICRAWQLPEAQLLRWFRLEGLEHLRQAWEQNRGILILTGHFGNWEFLSVICAKLNLPVGIVYRPLDFKPLDHLICDFRTRFGGYLIPSRKAMRRIVQIMKQKGIVAVLLDQSVDWYEGVFVDFFNQRTCTNKGLALLARKTGAPVLPLFMIRENGGFIARFLPPVPPAQTGDKTRDVEINTARYNAVYEELIRQYPEQWFWVHRRWKIQPFSPWPRRNP